MKKLASHTSRTCAFLITALALASLTVQADVKILREDITGTVEGNKEVGNESNRYSWSDSTNWTPNGVPGQDDAIIWATGSLGSNRKAYIDLDGEYSVGSLTNNFRNAYLYKGDGVVSDSVSLTFCHQLGCGQHQWHTLNAGVKLVIAPSAALLGASWDGTASTFDLKNGSEVDVYGRVESRHITWTIPAGTILRFAPSSYANFTSSEVTANAGDVFNATGGNIYFPNGLSVTGGNANYANAINHSAGTITFGGNFTSAVTAWTYTWSGGTIAATDDVAFGSNVALVVPASAAVTLDVASGKTFAASSLTADSTVTITKTGAGVFALAPTAAAIEVNAGGLALGSGSYDLSAVTFAEGTTINLVNLGGRVDVTSATLANATFAADLSGATASTVVFQSTDSDVLAKVQRDLTPPEGLAFATNDGTLYLAAQADYDKTYSSSGEISDMPGAGSTIAIDGAGTVVTLSSSASVDAFKALGSIEVKNGATLSIGTDVGALPPIILNMDATLEITNNATVVLANAANLSCAAMPAHLPILSIAFGSTLTVPGGMKFKNVDFRLYGTITKPSNTDLSPVFGYADNGETSYFAFTADGGVFDFHSNQSVDCGSVSIVCPASGGTVISVGTIVLRNASRTVTGWADFGNWQFGLNNPTSVPFEVLVDGTAIDCAAFFYADGAAHLTLVNGACIRRNSSCLGHYFSQAIRKSAAITIGEGCYIDFTTSDGVFGVDSQSAVDAVTVTTGGIYNVTYNSSGWGNGVFVSDGGVLGVSKLQVNSDKVTRPRTDLLLGFGAARLDGDLTIASLDFSSGNTDWDRHTTMANIPFSGTGNVTVTNGVPEHPLTVTMKNGANTATGTIKVAKVDGDAETKLYFANGANWAGTVVAGNVALTNLVDAAAASTNSFTTLDLADGTVFPIRVWKTGGVIVSHDVLNVDTYLNNGGKIELVEMGEELARGDVIILGTIGTESLAPTCSPKWNAEIIDGAGEEKLLRMRYQSGLSIIFR